VFHTIQQREIAKPIQQAEFQSTLSQGKEALVPFECCQLNHRRRFGSSGCQVYNKDDFTESATAHVKTTAKPDHFVLELAINLYILLVQTQKSRPWRANYI
jgi:hypothetical protein